MFLSVVIPVRNGEKYIGKLLDELIEQTYKNYEIIVVNDGSNDNTSNILKKYSSVKVYHNDRSMGANFSRNLGFNKSKGEIIVFTDVDCSVERDWLEKIVSIFMEKDVDAVAGQVFAENRDRFLARFLESSILTPAPKYRKDIILSEDFKPRIFIATANFAVKRETLLNLNGFDPIFKHYGSDDMDFAYRLLRSGGKIYCSSKIKVYHHHRTSLLKILKRYYEYGKGFTIFKRKHPESIFSILTTIFTSLLYIFTALIPVSLFINLGNIYLNSVIYFLASLPFLTPLLYHFYFLIKKRNPERILYIPLDILVIYFTAIGILVSFIQGEGK